MEKIKPGEWHDYVTITHHGSQRLAMNYAAGTRCQVSRDEEGNLLLRFDEETIVLLKNHYAFGIECSDKVIGEFFLAY